MLHEPNVVPLSMLTSAIIIQKSEKFSLINLPKKTHNNSSKSLKQFPKSNDNSATIAKKFFFLLYIHKKNLIVISVPYLALRITNKFFTNKYSVNRAESCICMTNGRIGRILRKFYRMWGYWHTKEGIYKWGLSKNWDFRTLEAL